MKILIIEDDKVNAKLIENMLIAQHYNVQTAHSYYDGVELLNGFNFALVILDWKLGDGDGVELLDNMRKNENSTPVLMLSANNDTMDKVKALDKGADDYLSKPYSNIELIARVRALLRRESKQKTNQLTYENVTINITSHSVKIDNIELKLTTAEFDLLTLFMQNPNIVLTRYQLTEHVSKDYGSFKQSNIIDVHIKNLRKKLKGLNIIQTVRGIGYMLSKEN